jgi:hypothetical protein
MFMKLTFHKFVKFGINSLPSIIWVGIILLGKALKLGFIVQKEIL